MKLAVWMEAKPKRQARMDGWSEEEKDASSHQKDACLDRQWTCGATRLRLKKCRNAGFFCRQKSQISLEDS
jgi:hypothetical protein